MPATYSSSNAQIFTSVTETMSRANTPTLPWVLPMYEHMRQSLHGIMETPTLPSNIREAAAAADNKLEQYFALARKNQYCILATGTHAAFLFLSVH